MCTTWFVNQSTRETGFFDPKNPPNVAAPNIPAFMRKPGVGPGVRFELPDIGGETAASYEDRQQKLLQRMRYGIYATIRANNLSSTQPSASAVSKASVGPINRSASWV